MTKKKAPKTDLEEKLEWVDQETQKMVVGFLASMALFIGTLALFVFLAWYFAGLL